MFFVIVFVLDLRIQVVDNFIARCRVCKSKVVIPDQGPCTDLEYMQYITAYNKQCKCGKNDWELLSE